MYFQSINSGRMGKEEKRGGRQVEEWRQGRRGGINNNHVKLWPWYPIGYAEFHK